MFDAASSTHMFIYLFVCCRLESISVSNESSQTLYKQLVLNAVILVI